MNQHLEKGTIVQSAAYHYKIVDILGQGSFGITYLATMEVPGSLGSIEPKVALKEFFMKEINTRNGSSVTGGSTTRDGLFEKYRQKFRHEAQNLSLMNHNGVVKVFESFDANGTSYITMDYLGGGSLDSLIEKRGHLSEKEAIHMTCGIADALSNMHKHHMLHLDLKPSNVMLNDKGEPVIIDFGLSKQYDESGVPETSTTVGGGTPGYAPLEQASYREGVGFPVTMDIYALGATLFKMLCGHRPPEADKIMNDGFPYDELKGVSRPLVNVVTKAMAFRKADRYQTVDEFIAALQTVNTTDEATSVVTDDSTELEVSGVSLPKEEEKKKELPPKPPTPQKKNSNTIVWIIVSIVAVLLIAGAAVYIVTQNNDSSDVSYGEYDSDDEEYEDDEEYKDDEDYDDISKELAFLVEKENEQCPVEVGYGITMESAQVEGSVVVYVYMLDEDIISIDQIEENRADVQYNLETYLTEASQETDIQRFVKCCKATGRDVVCRYIGSYSGEVADFFVEL